MGENYKGYFFVASLYLSEKQKGIQTQHCFGEMVNNYLCGSGGLHNPEEANVIERWLQYDKTTIVLAGESDPNLRRILAEVECYADDLKLPVSAFYEEGMHNALTCFGIIVPEEIWGMDVAHTLRQNSKIELAKILQSAKLA